ncbi:MAG: phosphatase PAP2 family protein [Spirochaetales bacterium]|nr:phosphatase PAP2 family protein [Spirochaetales bacterium]
MPRVHRRVLHPAIVFIMLLTLAPSIFAQPLSPADVNPIDRVLLFPYSQGLDIASDITQYAAFASPAALLFVVPKTEYVETALMYAGSSLLAFGAGSLIKALVPRDRPYMYFDSPPTQAAAEGDESFPSRHSCIAFSAAGFTSTLFALRYPNSPYRVPVTVASYALAIATAALRVSSGNHFLSDVAAGALIGTVSGVVIPLIFARDR